MPRALGPAPERILELTGGARATALVGVGVELGLFTRLEAGPMTANEVTDTLGLSIRGTRALLDGLVALNVINVAGDRYANMADASAFARRGQSVISDRAARAHRFPGDERLDEAAAGVEDGRSSDG